MTDLSGMPAVTLWEPWASAIAYHGKDIENRTWRPPSRLHGQRLAIHAGQRIDDEAIAMLRDEMSIIVATPKCGQIVCTATLADVVAESDSRWFSGPYGWVLKDIELVEGVWCRGRQGIWKVTV